MQELTPEKKKTRKNKYQHWIDIASGLKKWEIRLIELYNDGYSYNDIRDLLVKEFSDANESFSNNATLRALLYKKGRLNIAKTAYGEMMAEESFKVGQQIIKDAHKRASLTMIALMGKGYSDNVRFSASKEILDRNAGRSRQKVGLDGGEDGKPIGIEAKVIFKDFTDGVTT